MPLSLVLTLQRSDTSLTFVPQFGALLESLTHSIPRSFLVESLSAYAMGLSVALWLCPGVPSAFLYVDLVCRSRSQCRPSRSVSSLTVSVFCVWLLLWRGVSPCVGFRRRPWGSRWLHLYRLTLGLVSLRDFAVRHLELRSVFHTFPARCSACIHGDKFVSFTGLYVSHRQQSCRVVMFGHLKWRVPGLTSGPPPRTSRTLSLALTCSRVSQILLHPAIDIVWRWPCLPRLRLL